MNDVTFAGLKAKLEHRIILMTANGESIRICVASCPRCYFDRLEKRVREIEQAWPEVVEFVGLTALLGSDGKGENDVQP